MLLIPVELGWCSFSPHQVPKNGQTVEVKLAVFIGDIPSAEGRGSETTAAQLCTLSVILSPGLPLRDVSARHPSLAPMPLGQLLPPPSPLIAVDSSLGKPAERAESVSSSEAISEKAPTILAPNIATTTSSTVATTTTHVTTTANALTRAETAATNVAQETAGQSGVTNQATSGSASPEPSAQERRESGAKAITPSVVVDIEEEGDEVDLMPPTPRDILSSEQEVRYLLKEIHSMLEAHESMERDALVGGPLLFSFIL